MTPAPLCRSKRTKDTSGEWDTEKAGREEVEEKYLTEIEQKALARKLAMTRKKMLSFLAEHEAKSENGEYVEKDQREPGKQHLCRLDDACKVNITCRDSIYGFSRICEEVAIYPNDPAQPKMELLGQAVHPLQAQVPLLQPLSRLQD